MEQFVSQSHIYPGFMGRYHTNQLPTEIRMQELFFIEQAVVDIEYLDFILTDSIKTAELDASFDELDAVPSSVSSVFLHLVSTISDYSKLQLAFSIKCHKLWCEARALLLPVPLAGKMTASKLFYYFPVILWLMGSGLPHYQIT